MLLQGAPVLALWVLALPSAVPQQTSSQQDGVCVYSNRTSEPIRVSVVTSTRRSYCPFWSWGSCNYYLSYRITYRLTTRNVTIQGRQCCPGYRPEEGRCVLGCPDDRWGANCAQLCTCNISTHTCDDITGTCLCRPGFPGQDCPLEGGRGGGPSGGAVAGIVLLVLLLLGAGLAVLLVWWRRYRRPQGKPTIPQRPHIHPKHSAYDSGRGSLAEGDVEMISHAALDLAREATHAGPAAAAAAGGLGEADVYHHLQHPGQRREGGAAPVSGELYHHLAPLPADPASPGLGRGGGEDFEEVYDVAGIRPIASTTDTDETYHHLSLNSP